MRQTVRLVILAIAVSAVLASCALAVLYVRYGRQISRVTENGEAAAYTLGVWEGKLAVYEGGAAFPMKLYEVSVSSLPPEEQQRLQDGISVASAGELQRLLEDYTS